MASKRLGMGRGNTRRETGQQARSDMCDTSKGALQVTCDTICQKKGKIEEIGSFVVFGKHVNRKNYVYFLLVYPKRTNPMAKLL